MIHGPRNPKNKGIVKALPEDEDVVTIYGDNLDAYHIKIDTLSKDYDIGTSPEGTTLILFPETGTTVAANWSRGKWNFEVHQTDTLDRYTQNGAHTEVRVVTESKKITVMKVLREISLR